MVKLCSCACRVSGRHFYCVDFPSGETIKLDKTLGKMGITYADGRLYIRCDNDLFAYDVRAN